MPQPFATARSLFADHRKSLRRCFSSDSTQKPGESGNGSSEKPDSSNGADGETPTPISRAELSQEGAKTLQVSRG